jgi:peptide/nickel transport system substrate-binding protein
MAVVTCAVLAATITGCAESKRGEEGATGGTFIFGTAGAPTNFDPIFNTDGESFRVSRQLYDTLISHKMGTAELEPGLAEKWEPSADGKQITFSLRKGVKFHDGTAFDAKAVCFNFDRWYNLKNAAAQSQAEYYADVFEGFAASTNKEMGKGVYKGCEAKDDSTAILSLNTYKGAFPAALTLTAFSISSPEALKRYDADNVTQTGEAPNFPAYANEHPTGTGPFKFEKYDKAKKEVTLVRNEDYWGDKAKLDKLIFKEISDESTRRSELRAGTIHGYDYPSPADYEALKKDGFNVQVRKAFNILYLGISQTENPKLKDIRVRQAIAHALNREELVRTKLPQGAQVATQFMPDTVLGYAQDVKKYEYDVNKAKDLLKQAGAEGLTLRFHYPTEVTRPYMPDPKEIFTVLSSDLEKVGIKVQPIAKTWSAYLDEISTTSKHDLHLLGWTGDYNDPGNFVKTFFGRPKKDFGLTDKALFDALAAADAKTNPDEKKAAYEQVNRDIMDEYLPAIPISHSPPAIVVSSKVEGLIPSPLTDERFVTVSLKK